MAQTRRNSRVVRLGNMAVGGQYPISIQSMTTTDPHDVEATLEQIRSLHRIGCEIIRLAVPDQEAAQALEAIHAGSPLPIIADIHFDYRLALAAMRYGADGIRLNPGNIDSKDGVKKVAEEALTRGIPIRVGANSGSIRPALIRKFRDQGMSHDEAIAEALVESVTEECALLEKYGVTAIVAALKSSSVPVTVEAYRKFAERSDYPFHIGVTEAGTPGRGIVKSSVGIGTLLLEGIGDTLRVSLTGDPADEVITGRRILEACGLRDAMPEIISCPTCGRTEIDLIGLAGKIDDLVTEIKTSGHEINLHKIAVMGCAVNGPGEARDADIGIAGGKNGKLVIFKFGKVVGAFNPAAGFEYFKMEVLKHSNSIKRQEEDTNVL